MNDWAYAIRPYGIDLMPPSSYDPQKHHRRSIRLKGYDYTQSGMYFITICTHHRECLFGQIVGPANDTPFQKPTMMLNPYGEITRTEWLKTPSLRPSVQLGEWIIMPNHLHGILIITTPTTKALPDNPPKWQSPSQTIGAIVRGFKAAVTKQINQQRSTPNLPVWQRNYWEHIIRNEESYIHIAHYIHNNPATWPDDKLHPTAPHI